MATSIRYLQNAIPFHSDPHDQYVVTCFEDTVLPIVTNAPAVVDTWITSIEDNVRRLNSAVVGLDVEWRPNRPGDQENPVATLQLCIGRRCLIFQLLFSPTMPRLLRSFLRSPFYTFTGVGIGNDAEKLKQHWNLEVVNTADIGALAAEAYGDKNFRNAGLKGLTRTFLGKMLKKPPEVTKSKWDDEHLTPEQVQYACIDAYLSYKIGRILISGNQNLLEFEYV